MARGKIASLEVDAEPRTGAPYSAPPRPSQEIVGLDLHKCSVTLVAVNAAGETVELVTRATKGVNWIERWLAELPGPTWMAVESVGFAEWFIDRYRDSVDRIDLSN